MSTLPSSWIITTLSEITDTCSQRVPMLTDSFIYIDISSVDRELKRIVWTQKISGKEAPSRARKIVKKNDTIVSMTRPNLNAVALVSFEYDNQIASTGFDVLRPIIVDHRIVFYITRTTEFVQQMTRLVQGALYPAIRSTDVRNFEFSLPPLDEQKRIANKLDAVLAKLEACRERLDRVPGILKRFRQAVLVAATSGALTEDWREGNYVNPEQVKQEIAESIDFRKDKSRSKYKFKEPSAPDESTWLLSIPETWSLESVSSFAECVDYLRVPITKSSRATETRLYPYFGANGVVDYVDNFIFDDELVLVTEDETFYGREKPIAYRSSGKCWVNNHAHVLVAGNKVRADYLCYALMHYNVLPWLTGTTGRAKLTQGVLNSLPIAVPPYAEMLVIVRRVEALFNYANALEAKYCSAREQMGLMTPALLAKAFRGELVPQDPSDEPAEKLLERIRAARSAQPAATRTRRTRTPRQAARSTSAQSVSAMPAHADLPTTQTSLAPPVSSFDPTSAIATTTGSRTLADLRKAAGLNQAAVAKSMGLNQAYISQMETGKRAITEDQRCKLAEILGISLEEMP